MSQCQRAFYVCFLWIGRDGCEIQLADELWYDDNFVTRMNLPSWHFAIKNNRIDVNGCEYYYIPRWAPWSGPQLERVLFGPQPQLAPASSKHWCHPGLFAHASTANPSSLRTQWPQRERSSLLGGWVRKYGLQVSRIRHRQHMHPAPQKHVTHKIIIS